jgi:hypothetical protein
LQFHVYTEKSKLGHFPRSCGKPPTVPAVYPAGKLRKVLSGWPHLASSQPQETQQVPLAPVQTIFLVSHMSGEDGACARHELNASYGLFCLTSWGSNFFLLYAKVSLHVISPPFILFLGSSFHSPLMQREREGLKSWQWQSLESLILGRRSLI